MSVELCICSHELDHRNKPCGHTDVVKDGFRVCPCQFGQRVDLATARMVMDLMAVTQQANTTLVRMLAVMETVSGIQTSLEAGEDGRVQVKVQRANSPLLIVPG